MRLSGDNNPIHLDSIRARRLLFGKPVVHGVHLVMWALDSLLATTTDNCRILSLTALFRRPVFPGNEVVFECSSETRGSTSVEITSGGETKAHIEVEFYRVPCDAEEVQSPDSAVPTIREPRILNDNDLAGCEGDMELHLPQEECRQLFPNLTCWMEPFQVSTLLSVSRLVGVECPGLNSILYEIRLSDGTPGIGHTLGYRVEAFDERIRRLSIGVRSPGLSGNVTAFVRPEPVVQPDCAGLRLLVREGEFIGQNSLVLGASRGLGEVAAKLLASGGATVTGTFNLGEDDAARVEKDVESVGGKIRFVNLDVTNDDLVQFVENNGLKPTHLYYFCSPKILDRTGAFSTEILDEFLQVYVVHFVQLVGILVESGLRNALFPSTVFVDDPPLGFREYSVAKSAGETACLSLEKTYPGLEIQKPRLPRISTDQTATVLPMGREDAATLLLPHLRRFPPG